MTFIQSTKGRKREIGEEVKKWRGKGEENKREDDDGRQKGK